MKRTYLPTLLILLLSFCGSEASCQKGEIKLDAYDMMFALVGVSYEYPLSNRLGLEVKGGYDFYDPINLVLTNTNELEKYTSHRAILKLAMRRYFSSQNEFKGFALGTFAEIQWETYLEKDYREAYKDKYGRESDLEQPSDLLIGVQILYKHVYPSNILLEFNLEPGLEWLGVINQDALGVYLNIEIKVGYRFGIREVESL